MNLLKATLSGGGKATIIRLDQIAAIQCNSWNEKHYGDYMGYWTAKIILLSGKEINIKEEYNNVEKVWFEWLTEHPQ